MTDLLKIRNLRKSYGNINAVDGIDFDVKEGEIFGLLGPNGAGKSTVISMISTLFKPDSGDVLYNDKSIVENNRFIQSDLGIVPQDIALYPTLSGLQNLKFWGRNYGLKGRKLDEKILEVSKIIGIEERLKDRVDKYSGGMKRRLNIGVALLHDPKILIMDEPTVGIDPQSRNHILETVKDLNKKGMTIIYTSHYMEEVEFLCDRVSIMDDGKIIATGTVDELIEIVGSTFNVVLEFNIVEEELVQMLKGLENVQSITVDGDSLILNVKENGILKAVVDKLNGSKYHVVSMDVEKPNLETVFLYLTGKALRD
ncbi:MAG: ABC transporter ATP-binding protein [Clostridiales bacterium]|nr:ABC transporter ATP-binding protein [Clostridiales bacterium]